MKHTGMLAVALAAALPLALGAPLQAAERWSLPVLYTDPPFDWEGKKTEGVYRSFDGTVSKKWHVCVAFPHVKDPIYLAYSYGAVQQARDLGIKLTIVEAGGYGNLEKQVSQLEDCVAQGADAMVVFALSPTGVNKVVDEARGKGVVVQDCGIGINTEIGRARRRLLLPGRRDPGEVPQGEAPQGLGRGQAAVAAGTARG